VVALETLGDRTGRYRRVEYPELAYGCNHDHRVRNAEAATECAIDPSNDAVNDA